MKIKRDGPYKMVNLQLEYKHQFIQLLILLPFLPIPAHLFSCQFMNPSSAMPLFLSLMYSHYMVLFCKCYCKDFYYSLPPNHIIYNCYINRHILQFKLCILPCWWAFIISPLPPQYVKGLTLALEAFQNMTPIYFILLLLSISLYNYLIVKSDYLRPYRQVLCFPATASFSCWAAPIFCLVFPQHLGFFCHNPSHRYYIKSH